MAGYEPASDVLDHSQIDRDLKEAMLQLDRGNTEGFLLADKFYKHGAFSKSYAILKLKTPLDSDVKKSTPIKGKNAAGDLITGVVYANAVASSTVLKVQYNAFEETSTYNCFGGTLSEIGQEILTGCFASIGTIDIGSGTIIVSREYEYVPSTDNKNGRTIAGFSKSAEEKMLSGCKGCPYKDFSEYYNYYGVADYGDKWVTAALDGTKTSFTNGNADFGAYSFVGREEAAQKGMAYMIIAMYVIRELEDALDDCNSNCGVTSCNDDPVHAWDEAVAFYTGSLHGTSKAGTNGNLYFTLADKRCSNFGTCGLSGDTNEGTSKVNYDIFREFVDGLNNLLTGECEAAKMNKEKIAQFMTIPLIQGTLRYAYKVDKLSGQEKEKAEGGNLYFTLADKRCSNFGTCGLSGDTNEGTSKVNYDIFREFVDGLNNLLTGECEAARMNKEKIARFMTIPLIQGTLRYAYKVDKLSGQEKEKAEGAVFAAAILPKINTCNEEDAMIVFDNMKVGATETDFKAVKKAFENNYNCLKITCDDVGGLLKGDTGDYYEDAGPCSGGGISNGGTIVAIVLGSVAGGVALIALGFICFMRKREKTGSPVFAPSK
eukprot:CAMPEP_0184871400 /NCGR_PEP_ID=MMETSP0580-20130426/40698_1 /TAXON_ID=1118495 /ORGANISM="Dactyliosolen fragilissimus" /LENGTH=600 /DNA_ID=CAMNT_0027374057 /DNA_START=350 /DNA_END=2149 /DNA_ORIENTATION=-